MNSNLKSIKSDLQKYRMWQMIYSSTASSQNNLKKQYLSTIVQAVNTLKLLPNHGEIYYKIIYYNYLSPQVYFDSLEIIDILRNDGIFLSYRSYFRYKSKALYLLTEIINATQ